MCAGRMPPRFYWLVGFGSLWGAWECDGFATGAGLATAVGLVGSICGDTQLIDPMTLGPYCTYEVGVGGEWAAVIGKYT
jgi:hypothetical protein